MKTVREGLIILAISVVSGAVAFFVHPKAPSLSAGDLELELYQVDELGPVFWVDARADEDSRVATSMERYPLTWSVGKSCCWDFSMVGLRMPRLSSIAPAKHVFVRMRWLSDCRMSLVLKKSMSSRAAGSVFWRLEKFQEDHDEVDWQNAWKAWSGSSSFGQVS